MFLRERRSFCFVSPLARWCGSEHSMIGSAPPKNESYGLLHCQLAVAGLDVLCIVQLIPDWRSNVMKSSTVETRVDVGSPQLLRRLILLLTTVLLGGAGPCMVVSS